MLPKAGPAANNPTVLCSDNLHLRRSRSPAPPTDSFAVIIVLGIRALRTAHARGMARSLDGRARNTHPDGPTARRCSLAVFRPPRALQHVESVTAVQHRLLCQTTLQRPVLATPNYD